MSSLTQTFAKPVFVGAAGLLIAKLIYGEDFSGEITLFGQNISTPLVIGGVFAASTASVETLSNYIIPSLPTSFRTTSSQKLIVELAINAGLTWLIFKFGTSNTNNPDMLFPLILGAGLTILGDYAFRAIV
jgi:hypothetical protein